MTMQELLAQGHEILAKRDAEAERERKERADELATIFAGALTKAKELFRPLSDDLVVQPSATAYEKSQRVKLAWCGR